MPRAAQGRLLAFGAGAATTSLQGAATPRGLWLVLPEGEREVSLHTDRLPLSATLKRLRGSDIERGFFPDGGGARTAAVTLSPSGSDLARVLWVTVEALDPAPSELRVEVGDGASLTARLPRAPASTPGWLCGYRACDADPIAFASHTARRVEACLELMASIGARHAALTLSTRDAPAHRARVSLARGLDAESWTLALRALARGAACSLTLEGPRAALRVAPSPRGAPSVNETALEVDRAVVPEAREPRLLAAMEALLAEPEASRLQCWSAALDAPPTPRCVTRWERDAGVRALPITAAWLGATLRAPARRAFIAGAWREGALDDFHPSASAFRQAVSPEGAASGSAQVRAWWRRTGGAPMQGGIA
ncbi:MAG: hypothetical protein R3A48_24450 [Polyangiales bacterium]